MWLLGAVLVPLNIHFTERELQQCAETAELSLVISEKPVMTGVRNVLLREMTLSEGYSSCAVPEILPGDPDAILFTSGTLAVPKPVMSTHYARVNIALEQAEALALTEEDRVLSVLPMFHCFGLTATVLPAMMRGACLYFPADNHSYTLLDMIETYRCTVFTAVPALYLAVMNRQIHEPRDISSLRAGYVGGSTYSESFLVEAERCLGMIILPSLGQTEATAGITTASLDDPFSVRARTIGHLFPHLESRIVDGELHIRGYSVMQGYYGMPQETAEVIDPDGWLHTGDLVRREGRNLIYEGRKRELIIRGGENISPLELETILLGDSRIRECKVIGLPDEHYGETVCACIVPTGNLTEEDVREVLSGRIAGYKMPQKIQLFPELPKLSTGKPDLRKLREIISSQ